MPEALNQEVSQFNPESKIPAMQAENKQSFASQEDKAQSYSGGAETVTKELG